MKYFRFILVTFIFFLGLTLIGIIFWEQELQYTQPTPVPKDYVPVSMKEHIKPNIPFLKENYKPKFLHFYNPDCPCSRFNVPHFNSLIRKYQNAVDFYVVVNLDEHVLPVKETFGNSIQVIHDTEKEIAKACGVYATPQAVIIDHNNKLFYTGNFNKSRYCTDPETNFAALALEALLKQEPAPVMTPLATTAYGCALGKRSWFRTLIGQ